MKKFQVIATEVVKYIVTVEGESQEQVLEMVMKGEIDFGNQDIVDGWDFNVTYIKEEWQ
jgi:hypothetical protein